MDAKYAGKDSRGEPKQEYLDKLSKMSDTELEDECEHKIWLSAYASNNPHSDYHWHADACYDECVNRQKPEIYKKAYDTIIVSESVT